MGTIVEMFSLKFLLDHSTATKRKFSWAANSITWNLTWPFSQVYKIFVFDGCVRRIVINFHITIYCRWIFRNFFVLPFTTPWLRWLSCANRHYGRGLFYPRSTFLDILGDISSNLIINNSFYRVSLIIANDSYFHWFHNRSDKNI